MAELYLMADPVPSGAGHAASTATSTELQVEQIYDAHADYVFRSLRRLGVPPSLLKDALQDVFIVVHRRLSEFQASEHVKRWLFVIAARVAANHRRSLRRKWSHFLGGSALPLDAIAATRTEEPLERAEHAERVRLFYALLESLDDDKRTVFVLAELEEMSVSEIATTLGINVNTAHARLRAGRQRFMQALQRFEARSRRTP